MAAPPDILRDPARIAALDATRLAGTPADDAFDRLTRLAARVAEAPVAMLSFIDGERQWIKSIAGEVPALAGRREIPLAHSVCKHVILGRGPLRVRDLEDRPEVDGGLAARILGVRSYAGVPLVSREGHAVGVLCVGHPQPRDWDEASLAGLQDVAALAADEMELRRRSYQPAAERMFIALVEQSLAGIYVIQDGYFRYVNPCFARMLNYPPEHFDHPVPVMEMVLEEERGMVEENIRRRVEGEVDSIRYSVRARRSDASIIHLEVHGSRMELDGRPALIGVAVDVSDRVRAERERRSAMMARDRFYAMLSHELRTPVSAVMLYNDLLLGGAAEPLTGEQREAVERSQRSAEHLLELINDLLDLSKLEAGKLETRVEDVETVELAESVVGALAGLADENGCTVCLEAAERPLNVTGDARRVRQILVNLLSNAIKFGRGAPVQVRLDPEPDGVRVEVRDHGPGIPQEDRERIFEEFVQLGDGDGTGTGLGLPIARRLAELQGGSLRVASAPGQGSTFTLFLPAAAPTSDAADFLSLPSSAILR